MATKTGRKRAHSSRKAARKSAARASRRPAVKKTALKVRRKLRPPKRPKTASLAPRKHAAMNRVWCGQLLADANTRHLLIQAAGEHSIHVIQEFTSEMSDEEIAKRAHLRSSDVRVVLNKLHSFGLASYSRSRDKNSGWYSYVWRLNNEHVEDLLGHMRGQLEGGEQTVAVEGGADGGRGGSGEEYFCKNCGPGRRLSFELASNLLFKCDHCGSSLEYAGQ